MGCRRVGSLFFSEGKVSRSRRLLMLPGCFECCVRRQDFLLPRELCETVRPRRCPGPLFSGNCWQPVCLRVDRPEDAAETGPFGPAWVTARQRRSAPPVASALAALGSGPSVIVPGTASVLYTLYFGILSSPLCTSIILYGSACFRAPTLSVIWFLVFWREHV